MTVEVRLARTDEQSRVASFLTSRMAAPRARSFDTLLSYSWLTEKPNLGVVVDDDGRLGGFLGALYSKQIFEGRERDVVNLSSWFVDPAYRKRSLRMLGLLTADKQRIVTNFSPNVSVVPIMEASGFRRIDDGLYLLPPVSGWTRGAFGAHARAITPDDAALTPYQQRIAADHARYDCGLFLLELGSRASLVITIRRGRTPVYFADVIYASDPSVLALGYAALHRPTFLRHRTLLLGIAQRHFQRARRPAGHAFPRPTYVRGDIEPTTMQRLYSELVPLYAAR